MQVADDLSAQQPKIVHVPCESSCGERLDDARCSMKGRKQSHQLFTGRQIFFQSHPGARPTLQIPAIGGNIAGATAARWRGLFWKSSPSPSSAPWN